MKKFNVKKTTKKRQPQTVQLPLARNNELTSGSFANGQKTTPHWFKVILSILGIAISIVTLFTYLEESKPKFEITKKLIAENENPEELDVEVPEPKIIFEEEIISGNGSYFIKQPVIQGQQAYIAYPTEVNLNNPPTLIMYSHGSITYVIKDLEDDFMLRLKEYADYFTSRNYAFAASNEHGQNWGSDESVRDMLLMRDWIERQYPIQKKVNLVGFSMGGWPTMNYTFKYPDTVNKVALLAPTTLAEEWGTQEKMDSITNVGIKIWHGEQDINIGITNTEDFVNAAKSLGKEIEFIRVPNEAHFDMDTEKIPEIYQFFEE